MGKYWLFATYPVLSELLCALALVISWRRSHIQRTLEQLGQVSGTDPAQLKIQV